MDQERSVIAETYKEASIDSMAAARTCLEKRHFPSTCSRAYYAVMQIITAACYQLLTVSPKANRPNWSHESIPRMFADLMRRTNTYEGNQQLAAMVRLLLEQRENADYAAPKDRITESDAATAVLIAEKVRALLLPLMGDKSDG